MRRREVLKTGVWLAAAPALIWGGARAEAAPFRRGAPQPFDYAALKGRARALAERPYAAPALELPESLAALDYDGYQSIRFRHDRALWADDNRRFRVEFFHRGFRIKDRVRVHEVIDGQASELLYDPELFDFSRVDKGRFSTRRLTRDLGFAGLRLHFHTAWNNDVAVFLGASYFRAAGDNRQLGTSARGLAIDTGLDSGEEFPRFTEFWLERPAPESTRLTLFALLDSPSIAGAYRFDIVPGATQVMDVDAALYPRKAIARLGIAPLTSMFQCGENDRRVADDWRPEIHDSDGLSLWTGAGEWIWRPLTNPAGVRVNSFFDDNPRGFGLLQRDRDFDHYQDDGVYYNERPSVWVEPRHGPAGLTGGGSAWGKGAVQLVELSAADETFDNIVAYWNPSAPPQPGEELLFGYRLYWGVQMPFASHLARVVATRVGIGGVVGRKREYYSRRFAVDFVGGDLAMLGKNAKVKPVIKASRGSIEIASARPQFEAKGWRAMFDVRPGDDSREPINLRLYLDLDGQPLTETWLYQFIPNN